MDPCPFVRILVGNLTLKFPRTSRPNSSSSTIHPFTSPCYCKIKFKNSNPSFPVQKSSIQLQDQSQEKTASPVSSARRNRIQFATETSQSNTLAACFTLSKTQMEKTLSTNKRKTIIIKVYVGGGCVGSTHACGGKGKLLGKVKVLLSLVDLKKLLEPCSSSRGIYIHNGWVGIGSSSSDSGSGELYFTVKAEADPRYVFQFGGDPACSPQVFQVQGSVKQAVFTCKFSLRNPGDRALLRRTSMSDQSASRSWLSSLGGDKDQSPKERKGWSITIHDLSGSPVAMASMVTPFVPSPGSNRVSRSSPGAWLILRPSYGTWKPWGRLEAWREPRNTNAIGYRFELLNDAVSPSIISAESTTMLTSYVSTKNGGKFIIDTTNIVNTPNISPHNSFDLGSEAKSRSGSGSWSWSGSGPECLRDGLWLQFLHKGFVMSSTVKGSGKCSKPEVEVGVQHVNCTEDAAAYVALAAALDLSMDACRLFSHKLRKELRQQISQSLVV